VSRGEFILDESIGREARRRKGIFISLKVVVPFLCTLANEKHLCSIVFPHSVIGEEVPRVEIDDFCILLAPPPSLFLLH